ncbi:MAG2-interacting protein 2 isoform X2 [Aristolochia californica]|uniref:MAG2-interacting protein 2 isoform X2 n=1 Tax=Aristolochia californica TaxID=171875 RepID=UPI0035DE6E9F
MAGTTGEVLFETRHHASRRSSRDSFLQQGGQKGSYFSFLSGINQTIEKWRRHKRPKTLRECILLCVSPRGTYVAVAAGNEITILQKDDNYMEPCGIFSSDDRLTTFIHGAWSESHGILGVIDSMDTLYFIQPNAMEVSRMTRKQLKLSASVVSLMVLEHPGRKSSFLCSFQIITSDGVLHVVDVNKDPHEITSSGPTMNYQLAQKKLSPESISCMDLHPEISLLVLVGDGSGVSENPRDQSGSCCLSLWHVLGNMELEFLASTQFEGSFFTPKSYLGPLLSPKVSLSPQGKHVAALDLNGNLDIFNLDHKVWSFSVVAFSTKCNSQTTEKLQSDGANCLPDIVEFTWWSDHIIILAKRSGLVTMLDVQSGTNLLEVDRVFSMPILERVKQIQGCVFILESSSSSDDTETGGMHNIYDVRLNWGLMSFFERSASEIYSILVSKKQFQAALDFANHHKLDMDEVFKSQWLSSDQGPNEIILYLSKVKDKSFVLSECLNKLGPTEEAVKASIAHGLHITDRYRFLEHEDGQSSEVWNFRKVRLQLLQCKDRLETFMGINMGRFSVLEYRKFRSVFLNKAAISLAQSGKIGALNLLFKRHPYSLSSSVLDIISAIPETVNVQTYSQLLPGRSPPSTIALREPDWVECGKMIDFINKISEDESGVQVRTELILRQSEGFFWPSAAELSDWYKNRAHDIDRLSGQLDNCLCIIEFAIKKGIVELQQFYEDITSLSGLIYSDVFDEQTNLNMGLRAWEQLSDYEKFKLLLKGVKEETVVGRLREKAMPFVKNRARMGCSEQCLARWLMEIASENQLDLCLMVIDEGFKDFQAAGFFKDEVEAVEVALHCIYSCSLTDCWNTMASILSKLILRGLDANQDALMLNKGMSVAGVSRCHVNSNNVDKSIDSLQKRVKLAEGHVEAGRLLAFYQVPKPMSFFLKANADEKGVKQLLRLILSKFGRRQPSRSDNEWANMWRDLQCLQEKAFPFLDLEYVLLEFCRGLLKAGKFSLARNYLRGTGSIVLAVEKAENLVIQAAREYLFSASSLACAEIWKARECLNLFPNSRNIKVESDIIDALTVRLPSIGVTLLPMQFRQIRDPMEIITMIITSQTGTYIDVDELLEIANLLGLSSQDDIAAVQEAVAREAAVTGDLQQAFDLCLVLAKKGHGPIWDLCAAIARGPALDNMDMVSRKKLLGFALSHCDEESIVELLRAWKDLDMHIQCENLMVLTGSNPHYVQSTGSQGRGDDQKYQVNNITKILSDIAKDSSITGNSWDSLLTENGKLMTFASVELPWLLDLSQKSEYGKNLVLMSRSPENKFISVRTQALVCIFLWLARNDIAPSDDLIASLARSIMDPPSTDEDDIVACSFLLNLVDAFHGVEVIEEQLKNRKSYQEICSMMNVGMMYSLLNNSGIEGLSPLERRELLMHKFHEKHPSMSSDKMSNIDKAKKTFWKEWKLKLEEQKRLADQARTLDQILPGVETARFFSGDFEYIQTVIFSFIDSVKLEKKPVLKDSLNLANTYGLGGAKVLLRFLGSTLVSEHWTNDDIEAELSDYKDELFNHSESVIDMIVSAVYPEIDGCDKLRLSYLYSILSECYSKLRIYRTPTLTEHQDGTHYPTPELSHYYKILEQECRRVSFVRMLNFKNIAGLGGLNFEHFNQEVLNNVSESTVEALAKMMDSLVGIYNVSVAKDIISCQSVYKHYIQSSMKNLDTDVKTKFDCVNPDIVSNFMAELEQNYVCCRVYLKLLMPEDVLDIMKRYYQISLSPIETPPSEAPWIEILMLLLNLWVKVADDIHEILTNINFGNQQIMSGLATLTKLLEVFRKLLLEEKVSAKEGWATVCLFMKQSMQSGLTLDVFQLCQAMVFSGCRFGAVSEVFSEASLSTFTNYGADLIHNLSCFYVNVIDSLMLDLASEYKGNRNLHHVLSSLSKTVGNLDDLEKVRRAVWAKLIEVSDNMQLQSDTRVYALELMQSISGRNLKGLPDELSDVFPWEGWNGSCTATGAETVDQGGSRQQDTSIRFTNTLVALRSTQLVAVISSRLEIIPDDLASLDSAVSCFVRLTSSASSELHFETLEMILEEWEGLFAGQEDKDVPDSPDENNWGSDNWDEGWDSFQEDPSEKEGGKGVSSSVHPLHACWVEIIKKHVEQSQLVNVMKLIDRSLSKSKGILLTVDEAQSLSQSLTNLDCFVALKIMLLFPYKTIWLECLNSLEAKLKNGSIETYAVDQECLVLLFSSGAFSVVCNNISYRSIFSYLCYSIGSLSHLNQEHQLSLLISRQSDGNRNREVKFLLFSKVLFPYFVGELVLARNFLLVGFILSQFLHMHASFSLINIAEATIKRYLEGEINVRQQSVEIGSKVVYEPLANTVSGLSEKLGDLLQSAVSALPSSAK